MSGRGRPSIPLEQRFWTKVDRRGEDECWPWTASIDSFGYGMIGVGPHNTKRSHVVAYELQHGAVPSGRRVRHTCDNPQCVNPAHLVVGTPLDNMRDRTERGRNRGPSARLPLEVIDLIRSSTESTRELATRYGVSYNYVWRLRNRSLLNARRRRYAP